MENLKMHLYESGKFQPETHNDCKKFYNPDVCAIVRKDKVCLWKHPEAKKEHTDFKEVVRRIKEGRTL
jgi:hypothetical protein